MSRRRTSWGQSKPPAGTPALHRDVPGSAAWLLNETGGATARDSWGNDHGVLTGTTLVRDSSPHGGFGAIRGYTTAARITTTRSPKTAYTLIARIKTGASGFGNIFSAVGTAYVLHYFSGSGQFQFWTNTEFGAGTNLGPALGANRWVTLAFTREGSSITGGYKLYYDGVLAGTANSGTLAAPTNPFWIGMRSDSFNQPWDGLIDYVLWYERCLNAAEIRQHYHDPFRGWAPPGPRAWLVNLPPPPPPPPVTGDAAITQGAHTLSAYGTVGIAGAASLTQTGQALTASGTVSVAGTAAPTQSADTTAGAGAVGVAGSAAISQSADATAGTGAVGIAGAAAVTQAADTTAGAGSLTIAGSAAATQAGDSTTGAGAVLIGGSGVPVQSNTIAASGAVLIVGAASLTQAAQTLYSTGGEPAVPVGDVPGGVARRTGLGRVAKRALGLPRTARRSAGLSRTVKGNAVPILQTTLPKDASETVVYIADFSGFDEAQAGETLGTPVVDAVAGLTIGSPTVISSETNYIPAGYGIRVAISGGTAGTTYNVEFRGTFSGGSIRVVKLRLEVE